MSDQPTPNPLPKPTPALATLPYQPAPKPKVPERRALARRAMALVRRWARDTFNRESFVSSLRSLLWVAPLTLLIWIYAEREQQIQDTARFQVTVKSANPAQVASFVTPVDQVTATLKGPNARLAETKEKLDPRASAGPVQIVIDGSRTPGQLYEIDILSQIQKDYRVDGSGITVVDCTPRYVRVEVDTLQEKELEVRADPQARFQSPPVFDPPTVKVTVPASMLRAAKGDLYAKANLPPLTPGPHTLKAVPVTVEGLPDPKIPVRPGTVSATVDVGQADVAYKISSLVVLPVPTPDVWQNLQNISYNRTLPNVVVYGPPELIQQLKSDTLRPRPEARFKVTDKDIGGRRVTRELEYMLPDGIRLADDAPRTIEFDLLPRDAS